MADSPSTSSRKIKLPGGFSEVIASRSEVLRGVRSPLGFFVLALLIVEAFLILAGTLFDLPLNIRVASIAVGVLLFVLVVGCVYRLVVKHPRNLVFSEASHVAYQAMQRFYGDSSAPLTRTSVEALPGAEPPERPSGQLPPATKGS
jgi:type III secretory pathway component EscU